MSERSDVLFGIHAVESALKIRPRDIRVLQVAAGRDDQRLTGLVLGVLAHSARTGAHRLGPLVVDVWGSAKTG